MSNTTPSDGSTISSETENQIKGSAYEKQILDLIRIDKPAYLWHKAPETILIENGIIGSHNLARLRRKEDRDNPADNPLRDTGIDIIMMDTETECSLVQCKNGYKRGVTMHDLGGFMCWMAMMTDKRGYVYYTDKLSLNVRTLPTQTRIQFVQVLFDISYLGPNVTQIMPELGLAQAPQFTADPAKLEYQTKARDQAVEYYRTNDNGVLSMPCGTGKTYTAFLIAQNFKNIIILSPLKQFAKQNLDRFIEYGYPPENVMLVDSDGCRDVTRIQAFITERIATTGFLLSATYDSADVISCVLPAISNPAQTLIIGDEFHNLSAVNVNEETDPMNKIITAPGFKKLFMSATPRIFELEEEGETGDYVLGQTFFDMSFKFAIDNGFITDYRVWLPSVHEDLTDLRTDISKELDIKDVLGSENIIYSKAIYLFSCLVNTGVQKCIIYCVDTDEIRELMACMAKLNAYYCLDLHMDMITSANSATSRTNILDAFAGSSRIELLFSVRILDECIDIPSCDSIYITYPTKSKIRTIQRIMRCTRTVQDNKYKAGHVFIWCAEYDSILETLGGIKEIDSSFADKVKINEVGQFRTRGQSVSKGVIDDCTEIKKVVIGVKEYRFVSWHEKLDMVKQYIDENGKRPSKESKDPKFKTLGIWCSHQVKNYSKKKDIMKAPAIYLAWSEFINHPQYSVHFLDNNTAWNVKLAELKKYIDENGKRPSTESKDPKIKVLGAWCMTQVTNYSKKACIMADATIYSAWTEFINHPQYSVYFIDNDVVWNNNLTELKKYIDENRKRPSQQDKDPKIKTLGRWCSNQVTSYSKKARLMKEESIYTAWTEFINHPQYSAYFLDNNTSWNITFDELKKYIDENGKRPQPNDKDPKTKILGIWCTNQVKNYSKKAQIMKEESLYTAWTEFINHPQYSAYFLDNNTAWNINLAKLKEYIDKNGKRPSDKDKDPTIKVLGAWCITQVTNYSKKAQLMTDQKTYFVWTEFINHPKYSAYFLDNDVVWNNNLTELKQYIDENGKRPTGSDKEPSIKTLGQWCYHQVTSYSKKVRIMKEESIYTAWTEFINHPQYSAYFLDNITNWNNTFDELKKYIDDNRKRPSDKDKEPTIKALGTWCRNQITNYSKKAHIMADPKISGEWHKFITSGGYKDYFKC